MKTIYLVSLLFLFFSGCKEANDVPITHIYVVDVKNGVCSKRIVTDKKTMATSLFIRLAPMVAPVMHPVHVRVHHWYVPTRLIWEDFEDFITGGPDGLNQSEVPYGISSGFPAGSLPDYMGVPVDQAGLRLCSLPMRAYSLIYNE